MCFNPRRQRERERERERVWFAREVHWRLLGYGQNVPSPSDHHTCAALFRECRTRIISDSVARRNLCGVHYPAISLKADPSHQCGDTLSHRRLPWLTKRTPRGCMPPRRTEKLHRNASSNRRTSRHCRFPGLDSLFVELYHVHCVCVSQASQTPRHSACCLCLIRRFGYPEQHIIPYEGVVLLTGCEHW